MTVVGIDLGTTNSALAWTAERGGIRIFDVPQLVAAGEVGRLAVLPSFLYLPTEAERATGAFREPWTGGTTDAVAGAFARDHGAAAPARQIASAKSWLVNRDVDRTAPILPWGVDGGHHLSPVQASARILAHLREAWNGEPAARETARLEQLPVVLGVPASFDEEARELTVEAARAAGLTDFRVLEEPLAAVYAWIATHRREVADRLADGDVVLVCDVGGGTTDLTLIRAFTEGGDLRFERVAVGEHLLLGGDNLDLALAVLVEQKMTAAGGPALSLTQRLTLRRKCAAAKEQLLSDTTAASVRITLLGAGRAVVGGGLTSELTREEVERALLDGFLPLTAPDDLPRRDRRPGLRELGLPYESDPAITRHLRAFLVRAAEAAGAPAAVRPDAVLFNGGFFAPRLARARVVDALEGWFGERPRVLENARPEAAVAVGAAFYGRLRQNPEAARRLLIRAGSARSYYIGVNVSQARGDSAAPGSTARAAVCVMPKGTQEGSRLVLDREFTVTSNRPAAFTLYSTTQRDGTAGEIVTFGDEDEDVQAHAPLVTAFRFGKRSRQVPIPVRLAAVFTETGTLELWCESVTTDHRWKLAFSLRAAESDPLAGIAAEEEPEPDQVVVDDERIERAVALIRNTFTPASTDARPDALVGELENALGHNKHAWPLAAIRRLADALLEVERGRHAGPAFEARWLNLVGFCTRPGFGTPKDPWRVSELRKVYAAGLAFPKEVQNQVEWLVLWQRVAAGFSTGQQRELATRVMGQLGIGARKPPRINPQIEREGWRLLASLERLDPGLRTKLGDALLERLRRDPRNASWLWAIGRLGARRPLSGPLSSVVPAATAERWIDALLSLRTIGADAAAAVTQIGALTLDPARDVSLDVRERAVARLREADQPGEVAAPLIEARAPDRAEAVRAFGESLPEGLTIDSTA